MDKQNEWQVIVCPDCRGAKGSQLRDYEGISFHECYSCRGKGIVRIHIDNITRLEEWIP